jgi:hypothetical protein
VRAVGRALPPTKDAAGFLAWLHDFGAKNPGFVFCPTSDDVALLVASHVDSLDPPFRLYSPSRDALLGLLDKSRLAAGAISAGLNAPATWSPQDEHELRGLLGELPLPLLMKPRTQALSRMPGKTRVIRRRGEILPTWRAIRRANVHQPATTGIANVDLPVLQAYYTVSEQIYTVDGFVDARGTIVGAAACVKASSSRGCPGWPTLRPPGICGPSAVRSNGFRAPARLRGASTCIVPGRRPAGRTADRRPDELGRDASVAAVDGTGRACHRPAFVRDDPLPALVDAAQWLHHPRAFLRKAVAP